MGNFMTYILVNQDIYEELFLYSMKHPPSKSHKNGKSRYPNGIWSMDLHPQEIKKARKYTKTIWTTEGTEIYFIDDEQTGVKIIKSRNNNFLQRKSVHESKFDPSKDCKSDDTFYSFNDKEDSSKDLIQEENSRASINNYFGDQIPSQQKDNFLTKSKATISVCPSRSMDFKNPAVNERKIRFQDRTITQTRKTEPILIPFQDQSNLKASGTSATTIISGICCASKYSSPLILEYQFNKRTGQESFKLPQGGSLQLLVQDLDSNFVPLKRTKDRKHYDQDLFFQYLPILINRAYGEMLVNRVNLMLQKSPSNRIQVVKFELEPSQLLLNVKEFKEIHVYRSSKILRIKGVDDLGNMKAFVISGPASKLITFGETLNGLLPVKLPDLYC